MDWGNLLHFYRGKLLRIIGVTRMVNCCVGMVNCCELLGFTTGMIDRVKLW